MVNASVTSDLFRVELKRFVKHGHMGQTVLHN